MLFINPFRLRDGILPRRGLLFFVLVLFAATAVAHATSTPIEVVPQLGQSKIKAIVFSHDGRFIVSGSADHTIKLWDAGSGRELRTFTGHTGYVNSVAFLPDGRRIVSGGGDKNIKLWDAESGRELRTFSGHTSEVTLVAVSSDGRRIISSGYDYTIKLWDIETGYEIRTLRLEKFDRVAVSADGRRVVSGGGDKPIKLWDLESGAELRTFPGEAQRVISFAFSPDGRKIASGIGDHSIKLREAETGGELLNLPGHVYSSAMLLAFSSDGTRFISGSDDHTIKLWDAKSGRELRTFKAGEVTSVAFSADGQRVVSGGDTIKLWDTDNGQQIGGFERNSISTNSMAFLPDGRRIVSGNSDSAIKVWDTDNGREVRGFEGHSQEVISVAVSANGKRLVSGSVNDTIKLWDLDSGRELPVFRERANPVASLAISPDGQRIVSGSNIPPIKLWDADTGRELHTFNAIQVSSLAFSPDGRRIVSGNAILELWDTDSGTKLRRFLGHTSWVNSVAFSPDGQRIISGSRDGSAKLWDGKSGRELRTFTGHGEVLSVTFSSDGQRIISGGRGNITLWDVQSGREIRTFTERSGALSSVAVSSNGRKIVSVNSDGTTKLWDAQSGALLGTRIAFKGDEWVFLTPEGFFDASDRGNGARNLSIVRGLEVSSIDQVFNALYRPDLVREKLAGDPDGKVKAAAAKLDLEKVMASGSAPKVTITSPAAGSSSATDEVAVEATVSDQGGGIGKVEWRINGVTSGVETRGLERVEAAASAGRSLTVKRSLALERGENRIEVLAYNNKDLIASEPASVTVTWDGEKTATPPKLFVMAVGVNDYYDSRLRLSYAVPDATAIAEGFRKAGAGLYAAVDVTTVLDKDVTIANLDKVFSELGKKAQPRDVFVFFLAGHGKTKNGRYYFLPRDFRYEDEDSIEKAGMDQDKFQAWFAKIPARKSILLYDTCESGSLTGTKARGSDIDERLGALNRMTRATGRTFLTATTDDAPALEGYRGHGVFTYALLDALEHADVNKNGLIEVSELADYIDQKVPDISFEAFKLRQIPQRSIVGNNFALTNKMVILTPANGVNANPAKVSTLAPANGTRSDTAIPTKPTHVVISLSPIEVLKEPSGGAVTIEILPAGTLVTAVKSSEGWTLIAKDGKSFGYVAQAGLAPLQ